MPALDFPSSPTNGQTYGNYIYDSSITAWRNVNSETGITTLNSNGLKLVVPTSVVVGSGTATTSANGYVSFSGASSISLNGVFTSTYRNYRIIFENIYNSTSAQNRIQWRASGTNTATNYEQVGYYQNGAGAINLAAYNAASGYTQVALFEGSTTNSMGVFDVSSPNLATYTRIVGNASGYTSMSAAFTVTNIQASTTQFDGFTFYPSTGTFSGGIQVFAYNN